MSDSKSPKPRRGPEQPILRPHVYDGIQEYDQRLPNWWLFTFYGAIVWFVVYWVIYYATTIAPGDDEIINGKMAAINSVREGQLAAMVNSLSNDVFVDEWATDPQIVKAGEEVYRVNCIACHGEGLDALAGGVPLPGRSLTDQDWFYSGEPMEIFHLITDGSPPAPEGEVPGYNGAVMAAFGLMLQPLEIAQVTAYIIAENRDEFEAMEFAAQEPAP